MPSNAFNNKGCVAWVWVLFSYFELWAVIARLKWGSMKWLESKVEFYGREVTTGRSDGQISSSLVARHEAVRIAARLHFYRVNCLPKSIVLASMLRRHGYVSRVVIGVAKSNEELSSHAWVEAFDENVWLMVGESESITENFHRI